jgi:hypothetical protein
MVYFFRKHLFFINYEAPETTAMSDSGGSAVLQRIPEFGGYIRINILGYV